MRLTVKLIICLFYKDIRVLTISYINIDTILLQYIYNIMSICAQYIYNISTIDQRIFPTCYRKMGQ